MASRGPPPGSGRPRSPSPRVLVLAALGDPARRAAGQADSASKPAPAGAPWARSMDVYLPACRTWRVAWASFTTSAAGSHLTSTPRGTQWRAARGTSVSGRATDQLTALSRDGQVRWRRRLPPPSSADDRQGSASWRLLWLLNRDRFPAAILIQTSPLPNRRTLSASGVADGAGGQARPTQPFPPPEPRFSTSNVRGFETPPPGPCVTTVMLTVPAVSMSSG
jgi:hypothetical protein